MPAAADYIGRKPTFFERVYARDCACRISRSMARMVHCRQASIMDYDTLFDFIESDRADDIPPADLKELERADFIIIAGHQDTGETHYIAVAASSVAHEVDIRCAIRSAECLTRLTGRPAHAVVASWYVEPSVAPVFDSGRAHWFALPLKYLGTD